MIEGRHVSLAHGNGGRFMRELIEEVFVRHLANPALDTLSDAAHVSLPAGEVLVTTDGFTVQPLEFPGGDIGSLAVHGTVNDLAVAGAVPAYLSLNAFIEEGLEFAQLDRLVASMAAAARECGVQVAAGGDEYVPHRPANPCVPRAVAPIPPKLEPLAERIVLLGLDSAACRLHVSRERLVFMIADKRSPDPAVLKSGHSRRHTSRC